MGSSLVEGPFLGPRLQGLLFQDYPFTGGGRCVG